MIEQQDLAGITSEPNVPGEAIILAGGLGTRLRSVVTDLPKCMAPVAGRPFLWYVINNLRRQGIYRFIFSLGYKAEIITDWLLTEFPGLEYKLSIEKEPLGTGGAIHLACSQADSKQILVANGDTLYKTEISKAFNFHTQQQAETTLLLKPMQNFDRYGVVEIDDKGHVTQFREKNFFKEGLINGGVYIIDHEKFMSKKFPAKFSFEKDYLEKYYNQHNFYGYIQDGYFMDIGIPEDYEKANLDLKTEAPDLKKIDNTWTLFLDRDGVINEDKIGSYIFNKDEFVFLEGLPSAFSQLSSCFNRIIITTNQRGVGRKLMSEQDLYGIHEKMTSEIERAGGKIDKIYYSSAIQNIDAGRKPNPGMAIRAKHDFPDIDLEKSIIVGNNLSDMQFGRNAGMFTVFVRSTNPSQSFPHPDIDIIVDSLYEFSQMLKS